MTNAKVDPAETNKQAAALRLAVTRMARRLRQEGGTDLGPAALSALDSIERLGPLTPSELAEAEWVRRPTVTRILARLDNEALIDRSPDPDDGRGALISINADGRKTLRRVRTRKSAYLAKLMRDLPADDLATLARATELLEQMQRGART
jgi:DNA-binding MarR family transcriptional regulator